MRTTLALLFCLVMLAAARPVYAQDSAPPLNGTDPILVGIAIMGVIGIGLIAYSYLREDSSGR